MTTKLYVGNISFDTTQNELEDIFNEAGTITDIILMQDKYTGQSRGFGFVTMSSTEEAQKAIELINGRSVQGRELTVNEARPREERPAFQGGGGGGGGKRQGGGGGSRKGGFKKRF